MIKSEEKAKVNYEKITELIKNSDYSLKALSTKLGYSINYIGQMRKHNYAMPKETAEYLAELLGVKYEEILKEEAEEVNPIESVMAQIEAEDSQFEIDVKTKLNRLSDDSEYMRKKIDAIYEMLLYITNQKQQERQVEFEKKSETDRASELLGKMLFQSNDSVKYSDFVSRLGVINIREPKIIAEAIANEHCGVMTRGYGSNKTKWIFKNQEV